MSERSRSADYSHIKGANLKTPTLADSVADHLRNSIFTGQFSPGERLFEAALAREYGISRGPVREALALLEGDGLVDNVPRKGKFVRNLNESIIDEIYSLRRVLEPFAAEILIEGMTSYVEKALNAALEPLATSAKTGHYPDVARADLMFHQRIHELTGHGPLQRAWSELISGSLQMLVSLTTHTHDLSDPLRNHQEIVDAIVSKDEEQTRMILTAHIEDGWERAREAVTKLQSDH